MAYGPAPAGRRSTCGSIAFQGTGDDGESRVALLDPTTGDVTAITPPLQQLALQNARFNPGDFFVRNLVWSPDGRALLFELDRGPGVNTREWCGLFVVSADGSYLERLNAVSESGDAAIWAPDGTHMAVRSQTDAIELISVDRSAVTKLGRPSECPDGCYLEPVGFSADGTLFAVAYSSAYSDTTRVGDGIAVANVDGGSWTTLANDGWAAVVGWLPDGSVVANRSGGGGVYALSPDRPGEATALNFNVASINRWSPDRTHDLVLPEDDTSAAAVRVRDLATGDVTSIAFPAPINYVDYIDWSADSTELALETQPGSELWTVGIDGSDLTRIGTGGGNVFGPQGGLAWQPVWP